MPAIPKLDPTIYLSLDSEEVQIPGDLRTLGAFRRWATSPEFPERARIDWVSGRILIDMLSEDVFGHGTLKSAIAAALNERIARTQRGIVLIDKTRVTCPGAGLSVEPDVIALLATSVDSGRVRLVPGRRKRILEIEGDPDLVVECVSDSSVKKDTRMLREAYFRAGVREYWLADGRASRGKVPEFAHLEILIAGDGAFEPSPGDPEGYRASPLLGCRVRIRSVPLNQQMVSWEVETASR